MKNLLLALLALGSGSLVQAEIALEELVAPKLEISGDNLNFTVQPSRSDRTYQVQYSETMAAGTWTDVGVLRSGDGSDLVMVIQYSPIISWGFYRLHLSESPPAPDGLSLIAAGSSFEMGQDGIATPVHTVQVSAYYMGKYEVTKEEWDAVRTWGLTNGYTDLAPGNGEYATKGTNHPVHSITWYDMVKWCNARSQMEGLTPCYTVSEATYKTGNSAAVACNWSANGYRLPTEAEWEKAARGGVSGALYPWGTNTISHSQANYYASGTSDGNLSGDAGYHPTYAVNGYPYSSPVGSFGPHGYGLYDMAGNMWECCWDWGGPYAAGLQTDPRGATSGSYRAIRGGSWRYGANYCRVANRFNFGPTDSGNNVGFRTARSSVP